MEIKILVIGITCYNEQELSEVVSLLKDEYGFKKLPSNDTYLLVAIPNEQEEDIYSEMKELSSNHSNPAWEIISRVINNNYELHTLVDSLVLENRL